MPVIIINKAMAKQFFPDEEPSGRHLHIFNRPPAREIVGVSKTIKYNSVRQNPRPPTRTCRSNSAIQHK
jgi:hypothetical protein